MELKSSPSRKDTQPECRQMIVNVMPDWIETSWHHVWTTDHIRGYQPGARDVLVLTFEVNLMKERSPNDQNIT